MKKATMAILLPVIAGAALAGTGFGAWVFTSNTTTQTLYGAYDVENAYVTTFGSLAEADTSVKFKFDNDSANEVLSKAYTMTYTLSEILGVTGDTAGNVTAHATTIASESVDVSYKFTVSLSTAMSTYFSASLKKGDTDFTSGSTVSSTVTSAASQTDTFTITLAWNTNKKPDSVEEYCQMKADLSGETFTYDSNSYTPVDSGNPGKITITVSDASASLASAA